MKPKHRIRFLFVAALLLSGLAIAVQFYLLKLQYTQVGKQTQVMIDEMLNETVNQYQLGRIKKPEIKHHQAFTLTFSDTVIEKSSVKDILNMDFSVLKEHTATVKLKDTFELIYMSEVKNNATKLLNSYFMLFNKSTQQKVEINKLDSIFDNALKTKNLELDYSLRIVHASSETVIQETDSTLYAHYKEPWQTSKIPTSYNDSAQVLYGNPNAYILRQMLGLIVVSAMALILVLCFLFYYLNIILKQRKIEMIREEFVHSMTHELRNPLQSAIVLSEMFEKESVLSNPVMRADVLKRMQGNLQDLKSQIDTLLTLSLSEKQQTSLDKKPNDLKDMLESLVNTYTVTAEKPIYFSLDLDMNHTEILYDPIHLTNAIRNLIENAIKYSGEEVKINILVKTVDGKVYISVQDNGIGMSKDSLSIIFKPYHRVQNSKNIPGFGLGLSYVKWVVENHNGHIRVDSEEGKGSNFIIEIPEL